MIKVGSGFSGVGAFNQALIKLGIDFEEVYACDMDKYARQTYIHNYGEPSYYPTNVYDRIIPIESLDIYMTSPPCQAFSLAGKRLGKDDKRGILFFNSLEFIQQNKPRYFIFENVKGLLSDDGGKTFSEWVNLLGGKSVNGNQILFPYEDALPYHLYWEVLNAKEHGVPQNRERVFLVGIRDDLDNKFRFPIEEHLTKRLKDVLEQIVDDKYIITQEKIEYLKRSDDTGWGKNFIDNEKDISYCIDASYSKGHRGATIVKTEQNNVKVGDYRSEMDAQYIKVKSATSKGYEEATEGDSINFSVPSSETRRGRVGKGVAQTLDTQCNQGVMVGDYRSDEGFRWRQDGNSPAIMAMMRDKWSEKFTGNNPPIISKNYQIRRLTPRECFRLMDFPDSFTWTCSDSQAYKQAGNSIVVNVLYKILKNLNLSISTT
jgi:DNA (cytosine-5)-methyltransferase 1